jgi:hypothetical protein
MTGLYFEERGPLHITWHPCPPPRWFVRQYALFARPLVSTLFHTKQAHFMEQARSCFPMPCTRPPSDEPYHINEKELPNSQVNAAKCLLYKVSRRNSSTNKMQTQSKGGQPYDKSTHLCPYFCRSRFYDQVSGSLPGFNIFQCTQVFD